MRIASVLFLSSVALAAETGAIEGRLLHGDGTPWAGAQVTAWRLGEEKPWKRAAETDSEGRFRIGDLPPGRYVLRHGPKPQPKPKGDPLGGLFEGFLEDLARIPLMDARDAIEVEAGKTLRKDILLPKRAPVRFVLTQGGKPVAGAEVEVFAVNADNEPGWTVTVGAKRVPRTDARGVVSLGEIDEGRYAVEFEIGDWSVYGGVHEVKGGEPHTFPVDLGTHAVRVKILDPDGKPVPEATVDVTWGAGDWDFVRTRDMKMMRTKGGLLRVPYVRAGKIRVWVNGPDAHYGGCDGIEVGSLLPEPECVLRFEPVATLLIRVIDARGDPVPGVHVQVEDADDEKGCRFHRNVDDCGEISHYVHVRRWRVRVRDEGRGETAWTIVRPARGETKTVVLRLPG